VRAANALIVLYRERLDFVKAQQRVQTLASIFPGDSIYRQHALMLDFLLNGIPRQAVSLVGIDLGSVRYAEHRAILLLVAGETNAARRAVGMTNSSPSYAGAMVRYYLEPDSALRAALATALAGRAMQENVPDLADAWLVRAEDLLGQGVQTEIDWLKLRARVSLAKGDYGRARESASRVLALQAHDGEAMSLLAMTYMHLGRHDEALNLFTAAGDGDGLLAAALMRAREGEHGLAVRYAAALIKNAPLHGEAVRIQALSLEQLTMTNQALAALGAWHQAGGRDLSPLAVFARLEMALGRSQSALRLIDQTLAGIPTSRSAVKAGERGELAELFCLRGRILMGLGQFRPAEAAFAQAVSLGGLPEGKMVDLYLQHGDALLAIGRTARALSSWRRVQDLMPGEPRSRQRIKQHEPVTRQVLP
jgi:tetratricopeptide (TPR) repeat protein